MSQKTCLVTGANSGLGKEIALALAASGEHLIMVCRNAEKGAAALEEIKSITGSNSIDLLIADLSSQADIRRLAKTIHERYSSLHVLINNAGVVQYKKMLSADGIEMTLATNHLGPFLLTLLLLDLLEKSAPSRIINISSAIHKWGYVDWNDIQFEHRKYQFLKAYAQSKLFMNAVTFEWALRLKDRGITVNCVHPGAVKTALGSDSANNIALKLMDKMIKFFFISPHEAAKTPFYLATSTDMETVTGKYFVKGKPAPSSPLSYNTNFTKKVWEMSEKLTEEAS